MNGFIFILVGLLAGITVNHLADYLIKGRNYQVSAFRKFRYFFVLVIFAWIGWVMYTDPGFTSHFGRMGTWLLFLYFGVLTVIDIEHRMIFHSVSLVGGILCLVLGISAHGLWETLAGGAAGFGVIALLFLFGNLFALFITRIRKEELSEIAFGWGDVILNLVMGVLLGFPLIFMAIFLAILAASLYSAVFLLGMILSRRYQRFAVIPLGPFFVFGTVLVGFFPRAAQVILGSIFPAFF